MIVFKEDSEEYKLWCEIVNDIYMEYDRTNNGEDANELTNKIEKLLELVSRPVEAVVIPTGGSWVGKFALRKKNENQEPAFVYVEGINNLDYFVCKKLNTGEIFFSGGKDLVEMDYKQYKYMLGKHLYKEAINRLKYAKKVIKESQ